MGPVVLCPAAWQVISITDNLPHTQSSNLIEALTREQEQPEHLAKWRTQLSSVARTSPAQHHSGRALWPLGSLGGEHLCMG